MSPAESDIYEFGPFRFDVADRMLFKGGEVLALPPKALETLAVLVKNQGKVVEKSALLAAVWPGSFVEENNLTQNISALRKALGDPDYIQTITRRGYRFVAGAGRVVIPADASAPSTAPEVASSFEPPTALPPAKPGRLPLSAIILCVVVIGAAAFSIYFLRARVSPPTQRRLTRLTFDSGLQFGATWSPDGRFFAYSSDRDGKFDIWVQQAGGTNPVKITTRPGHNWQPDWSPDGGQIAFRSEGEGGGLFVVPALGGPERKIASFGYRPRWSPDGRLILFGNTFVSKLNKLYVVGLDGEPPREILSEYMKKAQIQAVNTAWYPRAGRISILGDTKHSWGVWNVSLDGTDVVEYRPAPKVGEQLAKLNEFEYAQFRWGPSGHAIYFEGEWNGVRNLWKLTADPSTRRFTSLERLTTGPGPDAGLTVSADGKRLAYEARNERVRIWSYALDSKTGRVAGDGHALTPAGLNACQADVSADGSKLAYVVTRSRKDELWEKFLPDGPQALLISADESLAPRWSPDAKRLAVDLTKGDRYQGLLLAQGGVITAITSESFHGEFHDWSPDGEWIVAKRFKPNKPGGSDSVLLLPISAAPNAEAKARVVTSSQSEYIDQIRISPNGRWIVFETITGRGLPGGSSNAKLSAVAVAGGPWIPITDGDSWDDKPRWSLDGNLIYFVSTRSGFPNVWAIRFDPEQGHPLGKPFQVTSFESPAMMVADNFDRLSISLSATRLFLSMKETSGSVWALDDVDK